MVKKNLLAEEKPRTVTLGDGKEYELPPLNLNTLANLEQTVGFGLGQLGEKMENEPATILRLSFYGLLKEKYPKLTLEKVGELLTLDIIKEVSDVLSQLITFK